MTSPRVPDSPSHAPRPISTASLPTNIIARPVAESDWPEWLRLRQLLWPRCTAETHEQEMRAHLRETDTLAVFVVPRADGRLAGFIEASLHPFAFECTTSPVGYVEGWYVDEDARRCGIGRVLVEAAEAWARSRGCTEMASDCEIDNGVSLAAHTHIGYAEVSRAIHFRKALT